MTTSIALHRLAYYIVLREKNQVRGENFFLICSGPLKIGNARLRLRDSRAIMRENRHKGEIPRYEQLRMG